MLSMLNFALPITAVMRVSEYSNNPIPIFLFQLRTLGANKRRLFHRWNPLNRSALYNKLYDKIMEWGELENGLKLKA